MADRAEKCALDIQSRRSTISVKEMAEVIRSHYPDDRELLEAAESQKPEPGTNAARELGCTCPETKNQPATRRYSPESDWMLVTKNCPIHGWVKE